MAEKASRWKSLQKGKGVENCKKVNLFLPLIHINIEFDYRKTHSSYFRAIAFKQGQRLLTHIPELVLYNFFLCKTPNITNSLFTLILQLCTEQIKSVRRELAKPPATTSIIAPLSIAMCSALTKVWGICSSLSEPTLHWTLDLRHFCLLEDIAANNTSPTLSWDHFYLQNGNTKMILFLKS